MSLFDKQKLTTFETSGNTAKSWTRRSITWVEILIVWLGSDKSNRGFYKLYENANIGIRGLTTWKQKIQWQNVTPSGDRTQASHNIWFQVQHSPFWASEACATEKIFKLGWLLESIEHDYIRSLKSQSYKQIPS